MLSSKSKKAYAFSVAGLEGRLRPYKSTMTMDWPGGILCEVYYAVGVTIGWGGQRRGFRFSCRTSRILPPERS